MSDEENTSESEEKQESISTEEDTSETNEHEPSQELESPVDVKKETIDDKDESSDLDIRQSSTKLEEEHKNASIKVDTSDPESKPSQEYKSVAEVKKETLEGEEKSSDLVVRKPSFEQDGKFGKATTEDDTIKTDDDKPSKDLGQIPEIKTEPVKDESESFDSSIQKSSVEPEQKESESTVEIDDHKLEKDYDAIKKEPSEGETRFSDSDIHKSSSDTKRTESEITAKIDDHMLEKDYDEIKRKPSEDETESSGSDIHTSSDSEKKFGEDSTAEYISDSSKDEPSEESDSPARTKSDSSEDESFGSDQKSSSGESIKTLETNINYHLRNLFTRPKHAEPKHPIFSSPFARHISKVAFGPKKPKWYLPLTSIQLYLFKDIMNCVEIGRRGLFRFEEFLEALQDFDPSVTRVEVLDIFDSMEKNEFEELDFGKFLFLLAYRDSSSEPDDSDDVEELLNAPVVTPRQCLILSAIAYYVLIASPEEIERYYIANTRRKATILHFHMEASRLGGLTETQMEEKQKKAMEHLGPLFAVTGSPYAYPVPFVPRFKRTKLFKEWTSRRASGPKSAIPMLKKPVSRPIKPIQQSRELGDPFSFKTKDDRTFHDMHYGRLPMPQLRIPEEMRMEMRKKCTVELKDYITRKAYEAKEEYRDHLKEATVLYNIRSLRAILNKGFPTTADRDAFIETYERYMPVSQKDVQNFSLWVKPAGYEVKHDGKPLYPDKLAFGSKIP